MGNVTQKWGTLIALFWCALSGKDREQFRNLPVLLFAILLLRVHCLHLSKWNSGFLERNRRVILGVGANIQNRIGVVAEITTITNAVAQTFVLPGGLKLYPELSATESKMFDESVFVARKNAVWQAEKMRKLTFLEVKFRSFECNFVENFFRNSFRTELVFFRHEN